MVITLNHTIVPSRRTSADAAITTLSVISTEHGGRLSKMSRSNQGQGCSSRSNS